MLIVLSAIDAPYRDVSLLWAIDWFVDRCRTTNNMLGDAYGAAVVEALSKKDLDAMDEEREQERKAQEDQDLESAHAMLDKKWKAVKKEENVEEEDGKESEGGNSGSSSSLNGSSVEVPAVISVDSE